jgi:dimethylhistidine N-methyltransferase
VLSAHYDYLDAKPAPASFMADVVAGLSASRKTLPPKYFYDARGSQLFDAICDLPEYYLTRTELALMRNERVDMIARIGRRDAIVEYGSGSGRKTQALIRMLEPCAYVAIDISAEQLRSAVSRLAAEFPGVRMFAVCADYSCTVPLQHVVAAAAPRIVYFPGSTIGNFTVREAHDFLVTARTVAGRDGAMLVGVDLKKDTDLLYAAYNDSRGITSAFNLNLLSRINRELHADFVVDNFEHRADYDELAGRVEMHLVSTREQVVHIGDHVFRFASGETIHTENSYKYTVEEFRQLAGGAGFHPEHCWVDDQSLFSLHYLTVRS